MEVPVPPIVGITQLSEALGFLSLAEAKFIESEDMGSVVTNCRQALDKAKETIESSIIDLKKLFNEETITEQFQLDPYKYWSYKIEKEIKTLRDFCGPGPHVELQVTRSEARYALIHTTAILSYLAQISKTHGKTIF